MGRLLERLALAFKVIAGRLGREELSKVLLNTELETRTKELLQNVLNLEHRYVSHAMKPKVDLVYFKETDTIADIIERVKRHPFAQYPVADKDDVDFIGIVYIHDILKHIDCEGKMEMVHIKSITKPVEYIPSNLNISEAIEYMKTKGINVALVVDEYGNVIGLVKLEDLVEEIFGELKTFEEVKSSYVRNMGDVFYVSARMPIDEFRVFMKDEFGIDIKERYDYNSVSTLAGFIMEMLGRFPEENEELELDGVRLQVKEVERGRIKTVMIYRSSR